MELLVGMILLTHIYRFVSKKDIVWANYAVPRERGPGQAPALLSRDAVWRCDAATLHGAVTLRRSMAGATLRRCLALRRWIAARRCDAAWRCDAGLRRDAATLLGAATLRRGMAARRCDAELPMRRFLGSVYFCAFLGESWSVGLWLVQRCSWSWGWWL